MRLLDKSRSLLPARSARHARMTMIAHYAGLLRAPYGMVICAGPTGSVQDDHALRFASARSTALSAK